MFFFEAIWLWIEMDLCMSCYRTLLFNVLCSSMEEANPLPLSPVLVLAVLISQFPLCVQTKFAFHFSQIPFLFSLFLIPVTLLSDANVFYLSCSSQSCSDWTGSEVLIGFEVSISFLGSLFCSFHYYTPLIWVYVHAYNLFIYTWQWYFSSFSRLKSLLHIVGLDMLSHIIHGFLIFPLCSLHREARRGLEECSFMSICCRWGISLNTSGQGSTELV